MKRIASTTATVKEHKLAMIVLSTELFLTLFQTLPSIISFIEKI